MRTADHLNRLLQLDAAQAYYSQQGNWYHVLESFPAVLFDEGGYIFFPTEESFRTHSGIRIGTTVNVKPGISSIAGYQPFSDAELVLLLRNDSTVVRQSSTPTDEKALRRKRQIDALVRNQKLVDELKILYDNTCQLCGTRVQVRPGKYYSEVHHIKPLGQPHNGPDSKANMICVCPNHHTMLDFFATRLNLDELLIRNHLIDATFVHYHNQKFEYYNPTC